jgi:putative transcriptional regulator
VSVLIKTLRRRLELTQEQFAAKVGVTYGTVNNWENGKRMPLPFLLRRLIEMRDELDAQEKKPSRGKARG